MVWTIIALLVVWAVGFLLVPTIAKPILARELADALQRPVSIRAIHFNPVTLAARIEGFTLGERAGEGGGDFASIEELRVNLQVRSLWERAAVVEELVVSVPQLTLVRKPDGSVNFADILALLQKPSDSPPARFILNNVVLRAGRIVLDDQLAKARHTVSDIGFTLPFMSNLPDAMQTSIAPVLHARLNGAPISVQADSKPFGKPAETRARIELKGVDIPAYLHYLPANLNAELAAARLDAQLQVSFKQAPGQAPAVDISGTAALNDVSLLALDKSPLLSLPHLSVDVVSADLAARGMFNDAAKLGDEATTRYALTAFDKGDTAGAMSAAAAGGDVGLYGSLNDADAKEQKERAQWLGQAAQALKGVPVERRHDAFAQNVAPVLKSMGLDDAAIQQIDHSALSDESLDAFATTLGGASAMNIQKTDGGDIIGIDPRTGKVQKIYQGGGKHDWKEVKNADGSSYFIDLNAEGADGGGGAASPAPASQPGPAGGGVPRSVRNNNPGNIEDGAFAKGHPGYKGSDGRFAIFETPEAGTGAQVALLQSYGKRGFDTPSEIIGRWAPASDGNPTPAYVDFVAKKLGVKADERLNLDNPDVARKVAGAIREFEAGPLTASNPPRESSRSRIPGSSAQPGNAPSGYRFNASGSLEAIPGGPADPSIIQASKSGGNRKAEADYRKEFNQLAEVKNYRVMDRAYTTMQSAVDNPSAAGDLSLIFNYMKTLDPDSAVREGEQANAQNATGIPERVQNLYNRALKGTRLNPAQRQDFLKQAKGFRDVAQARFTDLATEYRGYAEDNEVDPDRVVTLPKPKAEGKADARAKYGLSFFPSGAQAGALDNLQRDLKAPLGSKATNPAILDPASPDAAFNRLKAGQYYLGPDGQVRVK